MPENKATLTKIPYLPRGSRPARSLQPDRWQEAEDRRRRGTDREARGRQGGIVDAKGGTSTVTIPNVNQSNGVIHVIDTVLMPAS